MEPLPITKKEKEKIRKEFVETLNKMGVKNIKDIPKVYVFPKEYKKVWIIK